MTYEKLWEKRDQEAFAIDNAFEKANRKMAIFLRKRGWDYTCEFPDSCWRYVKTVKGMRICVNANEAFNIERNFIEPKDTGE